MNSRRQSFRRERSSAVLSNGATSRRYCEAGLRCTWSAPALGAALHVVREPTPPACAATGRRGSCRARAAQGGAGRRPAKPSPSPASSTGRVRRSSGSPPAGDGGARPAPAWPRRLPGTHEAVVAAEIPAEGKTGLPAGLAAQASCRACRRPRSRVPHAGKGISTASSRSVTGAQDKAGLVPRRGAGASAAARRGRHRPPAPRRRSRSAGRTHGRAGSDAEAVRPSRQPGARRRNTPIRCGTSSSRRRWSRASICIHCACSSIGLGRQSDQLGVLAEQHPVHSLTAHRPHHPAVRAQGQVDARSGIGGRCATAWSTSTARPCANTSDAPSCRVPMRARSPLAMIKPRCHHHIDVGAQDLHRAIDDGLGARVHRAEHGGAPVADWTGTGHCCRAPCRGTSVAGCSPMSRVRHRQPAEPEHDPRRNRQPRPDRSPRRGLLGSSDAALAAPLRHRRGAPCRCPSCIARADQERRQRACTPAAANSPQTSPA